MRCQCENMACTEPHELGGCAETATVAVAYVEGMCTACADDLPLVYHLGALEHPPVPRPCHVCFQTPDHDQDCPYAGASTTHERATT